MTHIRISFLCLNIYIRKNEVQFNDLYYSPNTIQLIEGGSMRFV